jgi:hypothetical protein
MWKVERLRQSDCIAWIKRRKVSIEHTYSCSNRLRMIIRRSLHVPSQFLEWLQKGVKL